MLNRHHLRTMRLKRRLTQQQLAEAIGVYQPDISHLERGVHRDVKTARLADLARALGVPMEQLITTRREPSCPPSPAASAATDSGASRRT